MKSFFALATASVLTAGTAMAGSLAPVEVEPAPTVPYVAPVVADWSGFYVGGMGGIHNGDLIIFPAIPGPTLAFDGTTYGGFVGYNFQQGNIVYGAEIAAQMGSATVGGFNFDVDYLVDARARIGYAFDDVMVYAAGGVSTGQITRGGVSSDASGFNVGAGLELNLSENVFVGGEYVYRNLSGTSAGTPFDLNAHAIQVRVGFRF